MMRTIYYTAALLAIHFTVSLSSPIVVCSGTDHGLEHVLKTGLRILDKMMCPSSFSQRKLAHLVREVCEAIVTENEPINNQTCDLLYFTMNATQINYPRCSNKIITDCDDEDGNLIQLWCSQALICSHLTGDGRVDNVLCEGEEDTSGWYNNYAVAEILCDHEEVCPSAYGWYELPEDYCKP